MTRPADQLACPVCAYDLSGLPGAEIVTCPECGGVFGRNAIALDQRGVLKRNVPPVWLFAAFVLIGAWVAHDERDLQMGATTIVLWSLALAWAITTRWSRGGAILGWSLLCAALAAFGAIECEGRWAGLPSALMSSGVPLAFWALLWVLPPRRNIAAALLLLAMIPGIPAVALITEGGLRYCEGEYWTYWRHWRAKRGDIWPMLRWDAVELGAWLFLPTALMLTAAWMTWKVCRRNQRA